MSVSSDRARKPARGPLLAAWGTGKRPGTGEMPLTGEEREKRYGGGEGSCRFLAPSTTNAFRSSSRKPCLRQTVRNSTISQDLASTLRGGSGGEAHPGLGSILCCSQGSALHRRWFPPRAGKSDGCSAAGVSSVWVKPGNRNLKYLERRELVPRARGVLRRQQGLEQGLDYLPGLGTEEWGELACSAGAGPVGAMEHMPWRKTLDFPFFPASHWLNPAGIQRTGKSTHVSRARQEARAADQEGRRRESRQRSHREERRATARCSFILHEDALLIVILVAKKNIFGGFLGIRS